PRLVLFPPTPSPPPPPLFPYTTLFRSDLRLRERDRARHRVIGDQPRFGKGAVEPVDDREALDDRLPVGDEQRHEALRILREIGVDRKSTRLNSSHVKSSYAVFCLKKKS